MSERPTSASLRDVIGSGLMTGGRVRAVRRIHPEGQRQAPRRDVVKLRLFQRLAAAALEVARLPFQLAFDERRVQRRVRREQRARDAALRLRQIDHVAARPETRATLQPGLRPARRDNRGRWRA